MRFPMTPFDAAWSIFGKEARKKRWWEFWKREAAQPKPTVFGCPNCEMPVDPSMQHTNLRIEELRVPDPGDPDGHYVVEPFYILSCGWCGRVMNIGAVSEVDAKFTIARKEA